MRPIKFRAWNKENKCWFEDDEFRIDGRGDVFFTDYDRPASWGDWGEEYEIMQYTGLKDKNGVEIYEGDILGGIYGLKVQWCDKCKSIELFGIEEDEYCYQCNGDLFWYDVANDEEMLEVIGNIYENPELLTNKEK